MRMRGQLLSIIINLIIFSVLMAEGALSQILATNEIDYAPAAAKLEAIVQGELDRRTISGVSIALVDNQRIVYSKGFGYADKSRHVRATPETVYRAGSISKLFTALATMQLREQGRLDIDKPITQYAPDFRIVIPFDDAEPITLRQLMCHRAGMVREAPVGSYFDSSEPGPDRTVASLASCVLVYRPDTKTKYSNSGVTIVGTIVAKVGGMPFEKYQQKYLLDPITMNHSAWRLTPKVKETIATGYLPVADGRGGFNEVRAPQFEFGILPAGNLYTTAEDLGRFLIFLFGEGRTDVGQVVKPETLEEMFTPQLTKNTNGFGLGFSVGSFRGRKTIGHMGAVYGFTSSITAIPKEKIGVVVLCNDDIAVGAVRKLNDQALALMIEAKTGEKSPVPRAVLKLRPEDLQRYAGEFESESFWAKIEAGDGILNANVSNQQMKLSPIETLKFQAEGRLVFDAEVLFEKDASGQAIAFSALGQKFHRVDPAKIHELPPPWKTFLGSYGPSFIPLIISARHGHLYASTENEYDYRLTPINQTVFKMPPGLYVDEQLDFELDKKGNVHSAILANMRLPRRASR